MGSQENNSKESDFARMIVEGTLTHEEGARDTMRRAHALFRRWFPPTLVGQENLPSQPFLMVGNHALFAFDVPLIQCTMLAECDRFVRGMADRALFENPRTRGFLIRQGAIVGDPAVCSDMMGRGKDLLVFPGGAHEVNKTEAERYKLKWKERSGFVRLAAEHGYTILPFGTIGPDEMYGRYMESEEWLNSRFGKLLVKRGLIDPETRPDLLPPIPRGMLGGLLPKPQRFYMGLGEPVDLSEYRGKTLDQNELMRIRTIVADRVEQQIKSLLLLRTQQADQEGWLRRWLNR